VIELKELIFEMSRVTVFGRVRQKPKALNSLIFGVGADYERVAHECLTYQATRV